MFTLKKAILMILSLIAQQEAMDKNFKPLGEISGADTTVERQMSSMATSEKEFVQLWTIHKELYGNPIGTGVVVENSEIPKVDFTKNVVIAYFAGQTTGIMGYTVVSVDTKGKTNIVRIKPEFIGAVAGISANSYGMWVFPRPRKAVELELIVGMDNGQPVTRKIARFEAPKAVKAN
jgi:hypothetical protein